MKKSSGILLLLLVMILAMSAVGAADTNVTSDLAESQAVDDSAVAVEASDAQTQEVDDAALAVDDAKVLKSVENTEILADPGDKNFTQLQNDINSAIESELPLTLSSNYVRGTGESDVVIDKNVNISGNDEYKIDANNLGGIFKISSGCSVLLTNVILTNGNTTYGGAIYNEGTVTIMSSQLTGNNASQGGAIYNKGTAIITGSTLDDNTATDKGGAVYSTDYVAINGNSNLKDNTASKGGVVYADADATLIIECAEFKDNAAVRGGAICAMYAKELSVSGSTFTGNKAAETDEYSDNDGGAIFAQSSCGDYVTSVTISNSTFESNNASSDGGALSLIDVNAIISDNTNFTSNKAAWGGAILFESGTPGAELKINGSRFKNNNASHSGGAIYIYSGVVDVNESLFENNIAPAGEGSAIYNKRQGELALSRNTIVGTAAEIYNLGTITSPLKVTVTADKASYRIEEVTLTANLTDDNGNVIKDAFFAFVFNTPAGLAAIPATINDDGKYVAKFNPIKTGQYNVTANHVDVTEATSANYADVTNATFTVYRTLTDLVNEINAAVAAGKDELNLTGDYTYNSDFDASFLNGVVISNNVTINGKGFTISGNDSARIFNVTNGTLTLNSVTVRDGVSQNGDENGGAIYVAQNAGLVAENVAFINNTAGDTSGCKGGAIYSLGNVTIKQGSAFINNTAQRGGAIYASNILEVTGATFFNNTAGEMYGCKGGAIFSSGDKLTIKDSSFNENSAYDSGAIMFTGNEATISSTNFTDNEAIYENGGAISVLGRNLTVNQNCKFTNNNATNGRGGAIYIKHDDVGNLVIRDSEFVNSNAKHGGAIYSIYTANEITGSVFKDNFAATAGALYLYNFYTNAGPTIIKNSEFISNEATGTGGAIYFTDSKNPLTITDNTNFTDNKAGNIGGAISANGDYVKVNISDATFTDNKAGNIGGAISVTGYECNADISDATFTGNSAVNFGGAIRVGSSVVTNVSDSTFDGNTANNGSAIYNLGTLTLYNNTISTEKALIDNEGIITNAVAKVLGNATVDARLGQNITLNATLTDDQGNLIKNLPFNFTITNVADPISANFVDELGLYTATYKADKIEQKVVSAAVDYPITVETGLLNIVQANVVLTIVANETIDRKQNETVTVKLADEWGNPLSFAVTVFVTNGTGQEVHRETITTENGNYTFELPNFAIGSYTITAMFSGSTNYTFKIATASFEVTEVDVTGTFTLVQELINESEAGATIVIPNDITYSPYVDGDYDYTNGIIINKDITIDGNGTTIDANKTHRIFTVLEGVTVTITNLTMKNSSASMGGAIMTSAKDLTLSACNFIGNDPVCGGALYIAKGNVTVIGNTLFENNTADYGGAIYVDAGAKLTVIGATFKNNTVTAGGAAIVVDSAEFEIKDTSFIENAAVNGGAMTCAGAVWLFNSTGAIVNSVFDGNRATGIGSNGGAVKVQQGTTVEIDNCTFEGQLSYAGGAISVQAWLDEDNTVTIKDSHFITNGADQGGAIYVAQNMGTSTVSIYDSEFTGNLAFNGSAINVKSNTTLDVIRTNFTENGASEFGGAIYATGIYRCMLTESIDVLYAPTVNVVDSIFKGKGNSIYIVNYTIDSESDHGYPRISEDVTLLQVTNSQFISNSNEYGDYAIYNLATLALDNNTVDGIIYNGGIITTNTTARILDNGTYDITSDSYVLNATLVDDNNNKIYDPTLDFTVNGVPINAVLEYNKETGVYNYTFALSNERIYVVDVTTDNEQVLATEIGILRNIKGTYTDLQNLIDAADDTLVLPYDFAYVEAIDGDSFPNGVVISKTLTIDGNAATIDGNNSQHIFYVIDGEVVLNNITFANSVNNDGTGAVYTNTSLNVANSTFINNTATENYAIGAALMAEATGKEVTLNIVNTVFKDNTIDNGGAAVAVATPDDNKVIYNIYDSTFINNVATNDAAGAAVGGGAIFSYGKTQGYINNTLFKDNKAESENVPNGGAIKVQFGGTLTVANSTFINNTATHAGGAISVQANKDMKNTLTVDNCTFTGNSANYGAAIASRQYYDGSTVTIKDSNFDEANAVYLDKFTDASISGSKFTAEWDTCPIYNNGTLALDNNTVAGVIYNDGVITTQVNSTILTNGTIDTTKSSYELYAVLYDFDSNDIYDPNFKFTVNGVILDVVPDYDNLTGLYTVTYNLTERINVIDAISANEESLVTEYGIIRNVRGTYTDLQNQIDDANGELVLEYNFTYTEEIDYEYFDEVAYDYVAGYFNDGVVINKPISIKGNGYTISGNNAKRIFNVTADFTLTNATLTGGSADCGGAIYAEAVDEDIKLTIINVTFVDNNVVYGGGAVAVVSGDENDVTYYVINSTFENNTASNPVVEEDTSVAGGAIYSEGKSGLSFIGNTTFKNNKAIEGNMPNGGAIKVQFGGRLVIINSTFEDNYATQNGGAIAIQANTGMDNVVVIVNSTFTNNTAGEAGGAVSALQYVGNSKVGVYGSTFTDNSAVIKGGAIYLDDLSNVAIVKSEFDGNEAELGGAVYALGDLGVANSTFELNHAVYGGAILVSDAYVSVKLDIDNSSFINNFVGSGGGAISIDATNGKGVTYEIEGCEFTGNQAVRADDECVAGGAIYTEGNATGDIIGSDFTENAAMSNYMPNGGAIKVQFGGEANIKDCTFTENGAGLTGGAIDAQANTGADCLVTVDNCTFTNNSAVGGGAIAALQTGGASKVIIKDSTFTENEASVGGAVYYGYSSTVEISGSEFTLNTATTGGAIYALNNLTVKDSNFTKNEANDAATIFISDKYLVPELTVDNCIFTDNAAANGGAIVSQGANGTINGSYFSGNGKDMKVFNINDLGNLTITNNIFVVPSVTIKTDSDVYVYGENVTVFGDFYWGVSDLPIDVTIALAKDGSDYGTVYAELADFEFNEVLEGFGPGSYVAGINNFTEDAYGNSYIVPSNVATNFVIGKANATINVTVGDNKRFDYVVGGTNVTLYLSLVSDVNGEGITANVNLIINDTAYAIEVINGTAAVNVTVFTPGVYAVVAEFAGNEYYNGSIYASDVFTLLNPYRTLSIDVNDTIFGVPALVTITVKDYAGNLTDGIVELAINGTAALIPVNGTLIVPITDLAIGEYLINATLMPTDLDAPIVNDTETFAVGKAPTSVEITGVWNVTYPEGVFVLYEVGNETDVTIAVSQNGTLVSPIIDSSIKGSLIIYGLSAGVYTINITNAENDNYTGSSDSALFEISKAAPVIEVSAVDVTYPDDVVVTVVSNAAGEVTVIVGGKNATETVEAGVAKNVTISGLAANEEGYGIFVELAETANYTSGVNDTEIVKVMKAASNVVIDDIADVIYHDVVEVTYTVDNKTDVTVVVKYANGTEVTTGVNTTVDGKVLISGLTAGGYTITIANAGDANHTDFTAEAKFNVLKDTVVIEPNATGDFVVDGEVNVTFTLPTDIDGIVQVTIDGQPVYAFIYDNGTYTIPGSYAAGPHTVIVTFSDDSNYENAMGQTTFDVFKVEMEMNATIEAATAVDDTNVTVILPEDATGHVLVYVDGDLLTSAPIVNGTAQAVVSGLDAGEHTVTAVYDGDDKYTNGTYSTTFETVKAPTNTTINATVDGFNVQIEVYVNSSVVVNGGTITLTFNGENTTADVVNGVAVFKFSDLPGKTYNITAVYSGNGQFLSSNDTGSAKVLRKASYLKPVYEPFIFNYGQLYKFRLVDKEGNPIAGRTVEFSVHSKVYYVTTDSEGWGQVQLTTEMLIHADRIFSRLIFRGDGYYKPCTYAVWFNAMQEPAKFSNVKAVKPSYKVSEKNKQITATLKDSKGKPIAGKKVSLTINGKTFKIVTNSKGVVTFSLNSMKFTNPGKVPFIVVFEDVNYKRTTAQSVLTLVKD